LGSQRATEFEKSAGSADATRNHVSYPWSEWSEGETSSRLELTSVAKLGDELWIGEKFQPNVEIAGSPRNVLRYSHVTAIVEVERGMS
jgi:hypothetical protein